MPYAALKIKIMPSSPDADLKTIEKSVGEIVEYMGGKMHSAEIQPIAFGLSALIVTIAWNEEKELEIIETKIAEIENVSSVEIVDFRRAIG